MEREDFVWFVCFYVLRDYLGVDFLDVLCYCVECGLLFCVIFKVCGFIVPVVEYCLFHVSWRFV